MMANTLTPEITVQAYAFCVRVAVLNRFLSIHTICGGFLSFPWKQIPFQNKIPRKQRDPECLTKYFNTKQIEK